MMRRFSLVFPYASALLVVALVLADRLWRAPESREAMSGMCHGAGSQAMGGLPPWLYYGSIGAVLVVSFLLTERKTAHDANGAAASAGPRFDLLRWSWLRTALRHPATRFVGQLGISVIFVLIIVAGLFGSQLPGKNIAPLLTWTIWWAGLILLILYAGKMWCYVCPWDALATWAEGLRLWRPRTEGLSLGLRWPRAMRNVWPATILFIALTWIELAHGATASPRVTAWLALMMLGMAFASAFLFDRKAFCRYGCLVGRISGLYALFAPVEIRARDRDVCRSCTTHSCYTGNADGDPCPTSQFLATMDQNTYCISCMECVKTCESDNVAVNLRPWGEDLAAHHRPRSDEAYLAIVLLALTGFHGLTMTPSWGATVDTMQQVLGIGRTMAFSVGMTAVLVLPVLLYALLVAAARWAAGDSARGYRDHFIRYAYSLLPIALFYHLAHNSEHLFVEGPKLLALASDPLGFGWNLFGTAAWAPQSLIGLQTLWGLQVLLVLVGHIYGLRIGRGVAGALHAGRVHALRSQLPMLVAMILFSTASLWLLKQPMEMRLSMM